MQVRTTNLHLIYVINIIKNLSCWAQLDKSKHIKQKGFQMQNIFSIFDSHYNTFVKAPVYAGNFNGRVMFFAVDSAKNVIRVRQNTKGIWCFDNTVQVGVLDTNGKVDSWAMDREDLQIEGLVSSGRYVA